MSESARVFSIPAGEPFIAQIVATLADDTARAAMFGPCALHEMTFLLPTRRAVEAMTDHLTRHLVGETVGYPTDTNAFILPHIHALGSPEDLGADILTAVCDTIPPAIGHHERQFYLSSLIDRWMRQRGQAHSLGHSLALAQDLAAFLDEAQGDHVDWRQLVDLVPDELAKNWQETLSFLAIITDHWPQYLSAEGRIDPVERRNRLLEGLADFWTHHPPAGPVVVAGSTGSQPATAQLLAAIARLPRGAVVLPGLDLASSEDLFARLATEDSHPQVAMARLLTSMQMTRADVKMWPIACHFRGRVAPEARQNLLRLAMMPAEQTGAWQIQGPALDMASALSGVSYLEAPEPRAEAGMIALILRHALETPDKTAALVTPDRNLARRVATELRRWNIIIDDTAGQALRQTLASKLILLMLAAVAQKFDPVSLLALLRHPWCRFPGHDSHLLIHYLEKNHLRGPVVYQGLDGLSRNISSQWERSKDKGAAASSNIEANIDVNVAAEGSGPPTDLQAQALIGHVAQAMVPLLDLSLGTCSLSAFLTAIEQSVDRLTAGGQNSDNNHMQRDDHSFDASSEASHLVNNLASDHAGRAILTLFDRLRDEGGLEPDRAIDDWAELLTQWLDQTPYHRESPSSHPRLAIWGQLEARLMHADLIILGGLNEGSWPPTTETGPWLSRPMRDKMGIRAPERRIGLAAHDFVQNACAPEVVFSRSKKIDGVPTLTSRWIRRLQALCGELPHTTTHAYAQWWRALDQPAHNAPAVAAQRPNWCPPASARPRRLSVTQVETLMADPYQIYARQVLGLREWEALNPPLSAAQRGQFVHRVLDIFAKTFPTHLPPHAADEMKSIADHLARSTAFANLWQPRLTAIWSWMADLEAELRAPTASIHSEISGALDRQIGDRLVTLTARADRIDLLDDGRARIIDYKTGQIPTAKDVRTHFSLQLPLEAAILRAGGFAGLPASSASALSYIRLHGGVPAGEQRDDQCDNDHIDQALAALDQIWAYYLDANHPFLPRIRPTRQNFKTGYDHLSRFDEWGIRDDAGDSE